MKVYLSERAIKDLDEIYEYISTDSVIFAKRTIDHILKTIEGLRKFPYSGRISEEYNNPNIREKVLNNYIIGYKLHNNTLEIATIRHVARFSGF